VNQQNEESKRELLQTRAMIGSQRKKIKALQEKDSDLKRKIQKLRMASCSSN
jgi:uncharacterized coiled-coil DUF342 family protein